MSKMSKDQEKWQKYRKIIKNVGKPVKNFQKFGISRKKRSKMSTNRKKTPKISKTWEKP